MPKNVLKYRSYAYFIPYFYKITINGMTPVIGVNMSKNSHFYLLILLKNSQKLLTILQIRAKI